MPSLGGEGGDVHSITLAPALATSTGHAFGLLPAALVIVLVFLLALGAMIVFGERRNGR